MRHGALAAWISIAALATALSSMTARADVLDDADEFGDREPIVQSPPPPEDARATEARAGDAVEDERLIEEDRVLSGWLLAASHGSAEVLAFRRELHDLDVQLRGRARPDSMLGPGLALIIPGGVAVVAGLLTVLVGALTVGAHDAACGLIAGVHTCGRYDPSGYWITGGVLTGAGMVAAVAGLVLATARTTEQAAFDRRDELRHRLRLWLNVGASADSASIRIGGAF